MFVENSKDMDEFVILSQEQSDMPGIEYHALGEADLDYSWYQSLGQNDKDKIRQELEKWSVNAFRAY